MHRNVALTHAETLLQWSAEWDRQGADEPGSGATEVGYLLNKAARLIQKMNGVDVPLDLEAQLKRAVPTEAVRGD